MKILPVSLEANSVCWCLGYQINPESGPRGRPGTNRQLFLSGWLNAPSPGLAFRVDMDWTAQGPHTLATFSLTNAPAQALETMSRSGFARFIASGSTLQQSWRYFHFKTPYDIGVAANYADPDGDGIANLSTRIPGGEEFFRLEAYEVAP